MGPKTAAFVCLFAFDLPVLPVDNGVLRVVRRLRLVRPTARDAEAERVLSPRVARGRHYALHVLMFAHAKQRCRPKNPKCDDCSLLPQCPFGRRQVKHRPPDDVKPVAVRVRRQVLAGHASAGIAKRAEPRGR